MNSGNEYTKAKYSEWLGSLFGACFIAFALGVWLHDTFNAIAWFILLTGVLLHSWGMYKMYQRNR
jgi:Flp pilus assembly protein TadB